MEIGMISRFLHAAEEVVIGVDEVGRGSLSCEVVACACMLAPGVALEGINDSKLLSRKRRELVTNNIGYDMRNLWAIGMATVAEIEEFNILQASMMAMSRAITDILKRIDNKHNVVIIVDGNKLPDCTFHERSVRLLSVVQGDKKFVEIAAASILAKQYRDNMMLTYDAQYPEYYWRHNFGYASVQHRMALQKLGPSLLHRMSFLRKILSNESVA